MLCYVMDVVGGSLEKISGDRTMWRGVLPDVLEAQERLRANVRISVSHRFLTTRLIVFDMSHMFISTILGTNCLNSADVLLSNKQTCILEDRGLGVGLGLGDLMTWTWQFVKVQFVT